MRPIDADVAIEELTDRSHQAAKRVGTDSPFWEGLVIARRIVNNLPPVQPEPKWIPVERELPETEEFVLTSLTGKYRNTTFEHACEIADYADGEWCVYAYPGMSAEKCEELIEAWMPLPEPYKPKQKTKENGTCDNR